MQSTSTGGARVPQPHAAAKVMSSGQARAASTVNGRGGGPLQQQRCKQSGGDAAAQEGGDARGRA